MLSKKMAFSLMSLITLLAFAFAAPSVMAAAFEIKIAGPTAVNYAVADGIIDNDGPVMVMLKVSSGQPIADLVGDPAVDPPAMTDTITVYVFDKDGFLIDLADTETDTGSVTVVDQDIVAYPMKTPKEHRLLVTITPDEVGTDPDLVPDIAKVIIEIKGAIKSADPTLATADASSKADAVRHTITLSTAPTGAQLTDIPKVFPFSGCVRVANRLFRLSKKRSLRFRPLMFVLC